MANIVIIGSGTVGTATGKGLAIKNHAVSYVDIDPQTIAGLREEGLAAVTAIEVDWASVDIVMLTVPTPTIDGRTSLDAIESAALDVGTGLKQADRFAVVVVRSTVPPTTTEKIVTPILEHASGKRAGEDFGVAMNPEFLRQATSEQDFMRPWITVLGCNDHRTYDALRKAYAPFGSLIVYCTPTEAEMIKYVSNVYNAVKISFFNEVHQVCQKLGVDSNLVGAAVARTAESMWNPLYGTRGGVPYGGACLPKDVAAFADFVCSLGIRPVMVEAAMQVNEALKAGVAPAVSPDKIDDMLQEACARESAIASSAFAERMRIQQHTVVM